MSDSDLKHIPVLYPTEEEFRNPIDYFSQPKIQRLGSNYGMLKLVPPSEFAPPLTLNDASFRFHVRLQTLSELGLLNRSRLFFMKQINNLLKSQHLYAATIKEPYVALEDGRKVFLYDLFIELLRYYNLSNGENKHVGEKTRKRRVHHSDPGNVEIFFMPSCAEIMTNKKLWKHLAKEFGVPDEFLINIFKSKILEYYKYLKKCSKGCDKISFIRSLIYSDDFPKSLIQDDEDEASGENESENSEEDSSEICTLCHADEDNSNVIFCRSCSNCFHSKCLNLPKSFVAGDNWMCSNCILGTGYYGFKEEDIKYSKAEFKKLCAEFDKICFPNGKPIREIKNMEDMFWKLVDNIDNRLTIRYGADIFHETPGETTGFPSMSWIPPHIKKGSSDYKKFVEYAKHPMNLINLPGAKGSLLPEFGKVISGMTLPWIYIGSTFSTFCWHLEDQYTLSANYQHEGDPKIWYSIPECYSNNFDCLLKSIAPDLFIKQPDLMHQLVTLISPYDKRFKKAGVCCYKAVQYPGEYIITYPKCYHAGFNSGYNFNEAVNFTLDLWIPFGLQAIKDYKLTGKKCVFDMWELMLNILQQYLQDRSKFQHSLIRICHSELLKEFNTEMRLLHQLKDTINFDETSLSLNKISHSKWKKFSNIKKEPPINLLNLTDDSEDQDIFCSKCKTICSLAFVVHYSRLNGTKRRKKSAMTSKEWNEYTEDKFVDIYCLSDYVSLVSCTNQNNEYSASKSHSYCSSSRAFANDEIHFIKLPGDIKDVLRQTEKKLDSYL